MMLSNQLLYLIVGVVLVIASSDGMNDHDEACTVQTGQGITVDSCDASKFLNCKGVCKCQNDVNQIYTFKLATEKERFRVKRGLKFRKIMKYGAVAAGGAYVGHIISKSQQHNHNSYKETEISNSPSASNQMLPLKPVHQKVFSCYSRVGSPCNLGFNSLINTKANTQGIREATQIIKNRLMNESILNEYELQKINPLPATTTPVAQLFPSDVSKMSSCVENAICVSKHKPGESYLYFSNDDPRIGVCECNKVGYEATNMGQCFKSAFGLANGPGTFSSFMESGTNSAHPDIFLLISFLYFSY